MELNKEKFDELLIKYPLLEVILQTGVVSNKIVRNILDIDRWLMEELQRNLLQYGAIKGVSATTFKASEEALSYIKRKV